MDFVVLNRNFVLFFTSVLFYKFSTFFFHFYNYLLNFLDKHRSYVTFFYGQTVVSMHAVMSIANLRKHKSFNSFFDMFRLWFVSTQNNAWQTSLHFILHYIRNTNSCYTMACVGNIPFFFNFISFLFHFVYAPIELR
jgi:hypothetical protein